MEAIFRHRGITIDYTPSSDVSAGTVVVAGTLVGVTNNDIAAGTLGALAVVGVFDVLKLATDVFAIGDAVYWDTATRQAAKASGAGSVSLGTAVDGAASGEGVVRVRLA